MNVTEGGLYMVRFCILLNLASFCNTIFHKIKKKLFGTIQA